jgi:hypothetical protein
MRQTEPFRKAQSGIKRRGSGQRERKQMLEGPDVLQEFGGCELTFVAPTA